MPRFRITYTDPETREEIVIVREFEDWPGDAKPQANGIKVGPISARLWAEDLAYGLADKGPHRVDQLD